MELKLSARPLSLPTPTSFAHNKLGIVFRSIDVRMLSMLSHSILLRSGNKSRSAERATQKLADSREKAAIEVERMRANSWLWAESCSACS